MNNGDIDGAIGAGVICAGCHVDFTERHKGAVLCDQCYFYPPEDQPQELRLLPLASFAARRDWVLRPLSAGDKIEIQLYLSL